MRVVVVLMAVLGLVGGGLQAAVVQGSPSATQIIQSLRPGAAASGGTWGVHPVGLQTDAGIRAVGPRPGAAAVPRGAQPNSQGSQLPSAAAPSVNLMVQFATNSAELTPAAIRTLDELGRALSSQALSASRFRIEGHTDAVGNREHNKSLSEQRAITVVDYLAACRT